jgi:Fic family protein
LPGVWKTFGNQAGNTVFVEPRFVKGTLLMGYDYYAALAHPLAKATMMMFLVSEVHPFNDGNGRLARIMLNSELSKVGLSRIIITTNKRQDYLRALRKLSRQHDPGLYIRFMNTAQVETAGLQSLTYIDLHNKLIKLNAFDEEGEGILF